GAAAGVRVLLSEIIIPVTPANAEEVAALSEDLSQIRNPEEFSQAAARYSATETRTRGGRIDWMALSELPQNLQPALLALSPGEVTAPLQLPNAVALFQLRDIQEIAAPTPRYSAIDYAAYYIPGGRSPEGLQQAAELKARVDTCDDLYGVAKGQPPQVLDRESVAPAQIPQDIALELAKLDPGEVSTALTRNNGQTLVFLMLCSRTSAQNAEATREQVANALTQRRLAAFAESELEQLQAEATIVEQ
ncbi:MAG TPA: peptidylprolyl isomerase, partial [Rhodobacteraceae bacterium]|nr:peptidylprolyl isomerase [Paracoccaceae bacterium]